MANSLLMATKTSLRQKLFKKIIGLQQFLDIEIINMSWLQAQRQGKNVPMARKRNSSTIEEREAVFKLINSQASPKALQEAEDLLKKLVIVPVQGSPKHKRNLQQEEEAMKKFNKNTSPQFAAKVAAYFSKPVIVSNLPSKKSEGSKDL
jgi:hypothetical protein